MATDAFPLDFEALQKGDLITQEKIESIYLVKYRDDPKQYAFCQMRLAGEIRNHRHDLAAHVKGRDTSIEILTDEQAEDHTRKLFEQARQRIVTTGVRRASIDRGGFDAAKRTASESQDRIIQASGMELAKIEEQARRNALFGAAPVKEIEK